MPVTPADGLLVGAAGFAAGAINAVAGGGTLVSFPALLATGMAARTANITSSVGLIWGYGGGSVAYRRELGGQHRRVQALGLVCVLGGVAGAVILLATPANSFRSIVPYLILTSCLLLGMQPRLASFVAGRQARQAQVEADAGRTRSEITWPVRAGVFIGAVYGSYFGAGLGVLLLGVLGILLADDLQRLNALKGVLSLIVNAVGALVFVIVGQVDWWYALILAVTASLGGTTGVVIARRLPPQILRGAVVLLGVGVAVGLIVRG
jgi:uncharacterized membrane protein YfcA